MVEVEYGREVKERRRRKVRRGNVFKYHNSAKTKSGVERVGVDAILCVEPSCCVNRPL